MTDKNDAINYALKCLENAARFIFENDLEEYTLEYDGTTCDGYCLLDEINAAIDDLKDWKAANE